MIDLPRLTSLRLGLFALAGDWRENRRKIPTEPFNYMNQLILRRGTAGMK